MKTILNTQVVTIIDKNQCFLRSTENVIQHVQVRMCIYIRHVGSKSKAGESGLNEQKCFCSNFQCLYYMNIRSLCLFYGSNAHATSNYVHYGCRIYVKQAINLTWYFFFHFFKALFFSMFPHTIISKHCFSSIFVFHPVVHIIKLWEL